MGGLTEAQRFWPRVQQGDSGCWLWIGALRDNGYGSFAVKRNGRWTYTTSHRWAYADRVGAIPPGWEVDHLCKTRACVRPEHLEAVPLAENRRRRDQGHPFAPPPSAPVPTVVLPERVVLTPKGPATHCKRGHEYAVVGWAPNGQARTCAGCRAEAAARKRKGGQHGTETHCPHGHPYSPENTYIRPRGGRECRTCIRLRAKVKR